MMRHANVLNVGDAVLVVVDLQEAFRAPIFEFDRIIARTTIMIEALRDALQPGA